MIGQNLFEDIFAILDARGPTLISDLIDTLRTGNGYAGETPSGCYYKKIRTSGWGRRDFEHALRKIGFVTRGRPHGAGYAEYVHHTDFSTIIDGRGKVREVK